MTLGLFSPLNVFFKGLLCFAVKKQDPPGKKARYKHHTLHMGKKVFFFFGFVIHLYTFD